MEEISYTIQRAIVEKIETLASLKNFCYVNKNNYNFCKTNPNLIIDMIIKLLEIDYRDPGNFIYIANNVVYNQNMTPRDILKLYMKFFKESKIVSNGNNITSFPIYPNMKHCDLHNNKLHNFPIQPEMEICILNNNKIKNFNSQPKMKWCEINTNQMETFAMQKEMLWCSLNYNNLKDFQTQPKMQVCEMMYNNLNNFSTQPEMLHCNLFFNDLKNFPIQPKMEQCYLGLNLLTYLPRQPNTSSCTIQNNPQKRIDGHPFEYGELPNYMYPATSHETRRLWKIRHGYHPEDMIFPEDEYDMYDEMENENSDMSGYESEEM